MELAHNLYLTEETRQAEVNDIREPFLDNFSRKRYKTQIGKTLKETFKESIALNYNSQKPNLTELRVLEDIVNVYANKSQPKSLNWNQRDEKVNEIIENYGSSFSEESFNVIDEIFDKVSNYRKKQENHRSYFTKELIESYVPNTKFDAKFMGSIKEELQTKEFSQTELEVIYDALETYDSKKPWETKRINIKDLISKNFSELSDQTFDILEKLGTKATESKYVRSIYEKTYDPQEFFDSRITRKLEKRINENSGLSQILIENVSTENKIEQVKTFLEEFYSTKEKPENYKTKLEDFKKTIDEFYLISNRKIGKNNPDLLKRINSLKLNVSQEITRSELRTPKKINETPEIGITFEKKPSSINLSDILCPIPMMVAIYCYYNLEKVKPYFANLESILKTLFNS